jgi:NO-binding membrane sensor protein with MHYT domain
VAELHQFAHGWINLALAFVMSFLGCLLGLVLTARAREATGFARARRLLTAAVAIGGIGLWLMQYLALLGFEVASSMLHYDVRLLAASLGVAVLGAALGLFTVGYGRLSAPRVLLGGIVTGAGVVGMHYLAMRALRIAGEVSYQRRGVWTSLALAVLAATVTLWTAARGRRGVPAVAAAVLVALAFCGVHYSAMGAVQVRLTDTVVGGGISPFELLTPITILACLVTTMLTYLAVSYSVRLENRYEEELLAQIRETHQGAAALVVSRAGGAHHR